MKPNALLLVAMSLMVLLLATPILGHHSFMTEFQMNKSVVVKGVLTRVNWANPHISFHLDVTDETGKVTDWGVNAAAPSALSARGCTRESLRIGDVVTIEGYPARNGRPFAAASMITLGDGRRIFAGSDGAAPK
jgi:hypothetical protein